MRSFFPAQAQTSARSWVRYLLVTVLLASLVVCLHGIGRSTMFGADLWLEPRATATVAFAVLAAVLLIERMARRMRVSDSLAFAVACTVVAAAFAGLGATLAALLQLLSAFCIVFFENYPRLEDTCCKIARAENVFAHHHLSANFDQFGGGVKQQLLKRNTAIYKAKWRPWQPHAYRGDA